MISHLIAFIVGVSIGTILMGVVVGGNNNRGV